MTNTHSGYLVEYTKENGSLQRGIIYYQDQRPEFQKVCKVLVKLFNQDMTPILDESSKPMKVLKNPDSLTVIGYIN